MTQPRSRYIAWLCFGLTLLSIPISLVVLIKVAHTPVSTQDWWNIAGSFVGATAFTLVGALILSRHPRHAIGWTFSLSGVATSVAVMCMAYGELSKAPGW